jgi:hypothetical protein
MSGWNQGGAGQADRALRILVDPRIELLTVVQLLADCRGPSGESVLTRLEMPYLRTVESRFGPWSGHPAVARHRQMHQQGFWLGHPPHAMLHLSEPPDLVVQPPIDAFVVGRAGGQKALEDWIELLRRFAHDSSFVEFYRAEQPFYQAMVDRYQEVISGVNYVGELEAYYGRSQASYTIILAPLCHPGGFGPRIERGPGLCDVYNISGPLGVAPDGVPTFGDTAELRRIVWHEFGHSFVNHLVDRHLDTVMQPCSVLLSHMRARVEGMPGMSWGVFVHEWVSEHVVRAVTTRLAYRELGTEAGDSALQKEHGAGWPYVGELAKELERYERNRTKYPSLEAFLPELLTVFRRVSSAC